MSKQTFQLSHPLARRNATQAIANAPDGFWVEIRPRTRSLDQNAILWSILTDISKQVDFAVNRKLTRVSPDEVKDILTASLTDEVRQALTEDGKVVLLGQRTSKMTVKQMSELIEFALAFGTRNDVRWSPTSLGSAS